jgi:hypothetical protein
MWRTFFILFLVIAACEPVPLGPNDVNPDGAETEDIANTAPVDTRSPSPAPSGPSGCYALGEGTTAMDQRQTQIEDPRATFECCEGLSKVDTFEWSSYLTDGTCILSKGGRWICVACGDADCGEGENACKCPDDCPEPF